MSTRRRDSDSDQPGGTRPTHELRGSVPRESPTERLERAQLYTRTALNLVTADKAAELLGIDTLDPGTTVDGLRATGNLSVSPTATAPICIRLSNSTTTGTGSIRS